MKSVNMGTSVLILILAGGLSAWAFGQPGGGKPTTPPATTKADAHGDEAEVKLADVPPQVKTAAMKMTTEANVKKVTKETEDGITTYEVEYTENGAENSATFSAGGDVLETEHAVTVGKVPPAALVGAKRANPEVSLSKIRLVTKTYYEFEATAGGKTQEVKVNAAGGVIDAHKR